MEVGNLSEKMICGRGTSLEHGFFDSSPSSVAAAEHLVSKIGLQRPSTTHFAISIAHLFALRMPFLMSFSVNMWPPML